MWLFILLTDVGYTTFGKQCNTKCALDQNALIFWCATFDNNTSTGERWDYCTQAGKNEKIRDSVNFRSFAIDLSISH